MLGLCALISMQPGRPSVVNDFSNDIVPALILLFDGLRRAYAAKAQEQSEEEEEEDEDGDVEGRIRRKNCMTVSGFERVFCSSMERGMLAVGLGGVTGDVFFVSKTGDDAFL